MAPIWDVMTRFEVDQAEWHPYWEREPLTAVQPESVHVSLYCHPAGNGKAGRALLVVSNLSAEKGVAAEVKLDFAGIGVTPKGAKDALSAEELGYSDGRLTVPLEPMRMRLVWVE